MLCPFLKMEESYVYQAGTFRRRRKYDGGL